MGCDIHLHVEVKIKGRWTYHDWEEKYSKGLDEDGGRDIDYDKFFDDPLYVGRNYNLFSILADVRNGVGFAGIDTGDPFVPIAQPRGLPNDATKKSKKESKDYGADGHSHSWFTVAELLAYDWQQKTKHRGWVDPWNFEVWRKEGKPHCWSGGVSGATIEHISNQLMARMLDQSEIQWEGEPPPEGSFISRPYSTSLQRDMRGWGMKKGTLGDAIANPGMATHYTLVEWEETYAKSCQRFLEKTLPALQALGTPDNVRIVFWFDN